ncbi:hypothetical protein B9Q13_03375 [Candidatus Marsarchaeota G2 archaeon ECH_B_SAG-G16]|uniref:Uncharacterized protein n=1 Tax=Candidatus Marsarchaeota G2 archaeon ECH_B_SAG-G16 TaxID=1978167 RepID=A0A2R6C1V8_9ARCH|nr:MAG: hypothetical protein B9Q13_03375 [Candidatus Marsarchaeota G2 archaeon ECH_B_SAG-G16]
MYPQSGWRLSDIREAGLRKNKKRKARLYLSKIGFFLYFNSTQGSSFEPRVPSVREGLPLWQNLRGLLGGGTQEPRAVFEGAQKSCGC